jgi:hypothetical protein
VITVHADVQVDNQTWFMRICLGGIDLNQDKLAGLPSFHKVFRFAICSTQQKTRSNVAKARDTFLQVYHCVERILLMIVKDCVEVSCCAGGMV